MADSNVKKVRVSSVDLPPFGAIEEGYTIRYRVISDDRNRFSAWSPFYFLAKPNSLTLNQTFINDGDYISTVGATRQQLNLIWEPQSDSGVTQYDIYLRTAYTDPIADSVWTYFGTVSNTIFNMIIPSGVNEIDAVVQIPTPEKIYNTSLVLYKTSGPIDLSV